MNTVTINFGYVYVTSSALAAALGAGVDLMALLRAEGLDLHDGNEDGKTIWNAQAHPGGSHSGHDDEPRRLCPNCFIQWFGDTCPDCDVALTPVREGM